MTIAHATAGSLRASSPEFLAPMNYHTIVRNQWWEYITQVSGAATQKDVATKTGLDQTAFSRWKTGRTRPSAEHVIQFARGMGRPPTEALVAAGFLTEEEGERAAAGSVASPLATETLLNLLEQRVSFIQTLKPIAEHETRDLIDEVTRRTKAHR